MKKVLFMAALAAAALSSCSNEEIMEQGAQASQGSIEDGAVSFGVYMARDTRAAAPTNPMVEAAGLANAGGFGVYAYEQGTANFSTYSASNSYPNFMYNQQVWSSGATAPTHIPSPLIEAGTAVTWEYSPIKYYSNNKNALHSFFAYGPYDKNIKTVFTVGKAPAIRYTTADNYDLVWAPAVVDMQKPGVTDKINFNFKHTLAKVSIKVAPFVNYVHGDDTHTPISSEAIAAGTTITVRSIKFVGNVASQGLLDLQNGNWTIEATEEGAYEITTPIPMSAGTPAVGNYLTAQDNMMVIPGNEAVKIQIVYDVTTVDPENPKNSSTVTNKITSDEGWVLAKGTAYNFKLDLGMTTVKFDASVVAWDNDQDVNVDLPNNKVELVSPVSVTANPTVITLANFLGNYATTNKPVSVDGKYYYDTTTKKLMKGSSADPSVWEVATDKDYLCNYVLYQNDNDPAAMAAPLYIASSSAYWKLDQAGAYQSITVTDATSTYATVDALVDANPADGYYKISGDVIYYYKHQ